jgi:hypothetical protein
VEEEKGGKKGQSKQSLTILEWRNGVVKEWVMDSKVEEPSIGGACSAMIHRFKCIPGWVRSRLVVQVAFLLVKKILGRRLVCFLEINSLLRSPGLLIGLIITA